MRISTKIGASVSTAALGAAAALGGAGVAQAQSLGSLGSSAPDPVVLTVAGDVDAVGGTITNNTGEAFTCDVTVTDADVMAGIEAALDGESTIGEQIELSAEFIAAAASGQNAYDFDVEVPANDTVEWEGGDTYAPTGDFVAGAFAQCGEEFAFAYEPGGLSGSLDMGSLGS